MTAVWTQPRSWSVGELVTASLMNQHMRDNFDWIKTPGQQYSSPATLSVTTAAFADMITLPAITSYGGGFLAILEASASCSAAIGAANLHIDVLANGVSVGGSNGVALQASIGAGLLFRFPLCLYIPPKVAGSYIFKLQAKVTAGTATLYGSGGGGLPLTFYVREV